MTITTMITSMMVTEIEPENRSGKHSLTRADPPSGRRGPFFLCILLDCSLHGLELFIDLVDLARAHLTG